MTYQVDSWGGDLHQRHLGAKRFDHFEEAAKFMESQVDAGLLCNVLHTDFKAPPERVAEAERDLAATLLK